MGSKYHVPSMKEIEQIPWNGYNVVSTFSGAGGSCLGYRMAGFRVLWANEFIPAAQDTYRANHPSTYLNTNDIREVTADDICEQAGANVGEIDLLDGSPPCATFSTNGLREAGWGKVKSYSDAKQRVDDLFFEYARILEGLQPKTFVAENVSGLVKGVSKGYFKMIIKRLKDCGYEVRASLLDAEFLGVPQKRERLIFVGVRSDLSKKYNVHPAYPKPEKCVYTLRDALYGVKNTEEELAGVLKRTEGTKQGDILRRLPKNPRKCITGEEVMGSGKWFNLMRLAWDMPSPTLLQGNYGMVIPDEDRFMTISELKRIMSVPDDFVLTGASTRQLERLGRMVPPVMMSKIAKTIQTEILDKIGEQ